MSLNKKYRACIISLVLLINIFTFCTLNISKVKADDDPDEGESIIGLINLFKQLVNFDDPLSPNPLRFVAIWQSDETMTLSGDVRFDLYFSSPFTTQRDFSLYHDKVNLTVYHKDSIGNMQQLENGNIELTLNPDLFGGLVQNISIKLKDINHTIEIDDYLIFTIEMVQSQKRISNFVDKQYENLIKKWLYNNADRLKRNDDPEKQELGELIEQGLDFLTNNLSISGEHFGKLVNALFSSAFFYGSESYSSSVNFSTESGENKTLYFQHMANLNYPNEINELLGYIRSVNETKPNSTTNYAWPPIAINEEFDFNESEDNDQIIWGIIWALYYLGDLPDVPKNAYTYYLHSGNKFDNIAPNGSETSSGDLSQKLIWTGSTFNRNKIITNITAELYIYFPKVLSFSKVMISASLKSGNNTIASDVKEVDKTDLSEFIQGGPNSPTKFTFNNFSGNKEIWYNENLTLEVSVVDKPISLRKVKINYDSRDYPSSFTLVLNETENIKIVEGTDDKLVYAGGSTEYLINISSEYNDTLDINVETVDSVGDWAELNYPKSVDVDAGDTATIHLFVYSTAVDDSAYGSSDGVGKDEIEFTILVSGNTGFDSDQSKVSVSRDAEGIYNFQIIPIKESIEIKHGESKNYSFIIRNLNEGFIRDGYIIQVSSEHDFTIEYPLYAAGKDLEDLDIYDENAINPVEGSFNISVKIPWYTDIKSDILFINVTSDQSIKRNDPYSIDLNVTTKVVTPNIFESIYEMFESIAQKIGLKSRYAGWIIIGALFLLILIIVFIILIIKKRKFVDLICLDRIKEILPDETAVYEITVKNPYRRPMNYNIETKINSDVKSWNVNLDKSQITVESGETKNILMKVVPNDFIRKDDWLEVKVIAKPTDKNKSCEISTITSVKECEIKLEIIGVFHWPKKFNKGDRVETSFKVVNTGNVSAQNITITLYVNGEEKNKVEDITIPRGGYAEAEIPWIAVKGKNDVYIIVN